MEKDDLLRGKRILIVDDEGDVLESLEELLTKPAIHSKYWTRRKDESSSRILPFLSLSCLTVQL